MKAITLALQAIIFLVNLVQSSNRRKKDEEIKSDPTGAWESKFGKLQQPADKDGNSTDSVRPASDSSSEDKRRD